MLGSRLWGNARARDKVVLHGVLLYAVYVVVAMMLWRGY